MDIETLTILALVFAAIATILAFIFIVPDKKRGSLNRFGKFLHDTFNFKYLIIEKVLQALYILVTCYVVFVGFFMLFYVQKYRWGDDKWYGGYGLLLMIVGPIAVRLAYEGIMMFILLIKNVIQINNKLRYPDDYNKNKKQSEAAPAPAPCAEPAAHTEPAAYAEYAPKAFCCECGAKLAEGAMFCTECGAKR